MKQIETEKKSTNDRSGALGPRMQQVLLQSIGPWKREVQGDEEAQLAEIKRRPVRHKYDADEARRRLTKPVKRRRVAAAKAKPSPS